MFTAVFFAFLLGFLFGIGKPGFLLMTGVVTSTMWFCQKIIGQVLRTMISKNKWKAMYYVLHFQKKHKVTISPCGYYGDRPVDIIQRIDSFEQGEIYDTLIKIIKDIKPTQ